VIYDSRPKAKNVFEFSKKNLACGGHAKPKWFLDFGSEET